ADAGSKLVRRRRAAVPENPAWRPEACMVQVIVSTSAAARLDAARAFVVERSSVARAARVPSDLVIAGASRGAADDFARSVARGAAATFGLTRFSFIELAAKAVDALIVARSVAPGFTPRVHGTQAGGEAMAARAVFDAIGGGELEYFAPVAGMPGFP